MLLFWSRLRAGAGEIRQFVSKSATNWRPLPTIELLTEKHDRVSFDCGEPSLNEQARTFYRKYGIAETPDDPMRLYLPIRKVLLSGLMEP